MMSTFEWISLIGILLTGFAALYRQLTKIEVALVGKVDYDECNQRRRECPCVREMDKIKEKIEK